MPTIKEIDIIYSLAHELCVSRLRDAYGESVSEKDLEVLADYELEGMLKKKLEERRCAV